jgi:hypothetical protein
MKEKNSRLKTEIKNEAFKNNFKEKPFAIWKISEDKTVKRCSRENFSEIFF